VNSKTEQNGVVRRKTTTPAEAVLFNSSDKVNCPSCGAGIVLTEVLTARLQQRAQEHLEHELQAARSRLNAEVAGEKQRLETELGLAKKKLEEAQAAQLKAARKERELDEQILKRELELEEKLAKEREKLRVAERTRAEAAAKREVQERQEELHVLSERLAAAEATESELRRKRTEVEAREKAVELELQRRLDTLREALTCELRKQAEEAAGLEVQRRELEITRLREQIGRISKGGVPGEIIGESLEVVLRGELARTCPLDLVEEVPRGVRGCDIIQSVRNSSQAILGKVCWEAKNTKTFDRAWIEKLKQAQRDTNSDLAVLVSVAMPDGIRHLGYLEGVWVCAPNAAGGVAILIRHTLMRIGESKVLAESRDDRVRALCDYIGSNQFRLAAENVIGIVKSMEQQLDSEQKAFTRAWSKRRQHIMSLSTQVIEVVGTLEGAARRDLIGTDDNLLIDLEEQS